MGLRMKVVMCVMTLVWINEGLGHVAATGGQHPNSVREKSPKVSQLEVARQQLQRYLVANVRRPAGGAAALAEGPDFRMTQGYSGALLPNMSSPMYSPDGALTLAAARLLTANDDMFSGICKARQESVELPRDPDYRVIYIPECTEAARCGGCCTETGAYSCHVTKTETQQVQVAAFRQNHGSFEFLGYKYIDVEQHLECVCQPDSLTSSCSLPSHCDPDLHNINKDSCSCSCKRTRQEAQCQLKGKLWNDELCACVCPNVNKQCSRRRVFDDNSCRCVRKCRCPPGNMTYTNAAGRCLCRKVDLSDLKQNTRFEWYTRHKVSSKSQDGS